MTESTTSICSKADSNNSKGVISLIPLPKIDEVFGRLKGAKIFTTIDLRQEYHHIALTEDLIQKTAYTTPFGKLNLLSVLLDSTRHLHTLWP